MILPEIGKIAVNERTGNLYLIFEPGRMVRIDEPLEILNFNPAEYPAGFCSIELPAESRKIIFDRFKAVGDNTKNSKP